MISRSVGVVMCAVVALGSKSATLRAQVPEKRARPQTHIPVKKEIIPPPVAAAPVVKGTNTEVVIPPVVTNIVTPVPGMNTVIAQNAPGIGARPVPWLPILGLLGGALVLATRDHGGTAAADTTTTTTTPPVVPPVPPVVPTPPVVPPTPPVVPPTPPVVPPTPPVVPPTPPVVPPPPEVPPTPPVTTVPEPATMTMVATGLAGLALAMRRRRR